MLLTNHVLTGTLLGVTIDNPVLLAPAGIASHIGMDLLPHFGYPPAKRQFFHPFFLVWAVLDFSASIVIVSAACFAWPQRTTLILIGTLAAALPDLVYVPITLTKNRVYRVPGYRRMVDWLQDIQRIEKPWGLVVEVAWAGLMLYFLGRQV
jgi:hypothetical protein